MRSVYSVLVGKHEWKRPFVSSRFRLEDNIIMYLKEIR
jgi:hypothetical protein